MKHITTILLLIIGLCTTASAQKLKQLEAAPKTRMIPMTYEHPSGDNIQKYVELDTLIQQRVLDSLVTLRALMNAGGGGIVIYGTFSKDADAALGGTPLLGHYYAADPNELGVKNGTIVRREN